MLVSCPALLAEAYEACGEGWCLGPFMPLYESPLSTTLDFTVIRVIAFLFSLVSGTMKESGHPKC